MAGREGEYPSFLQPVTGGIKNKESPLQACIREVEEETGVTLAPEQLQPLSEPFIAVIDKNLTIKKSIFYAAFPDVSIDLNPDEHIGWEICKLNEVESRLYWQSNKDTWQIVYRRLTLCQS